MDTFLSDDSYFLFLPASDRFACHSPPVFLLRFCPAVGPVLTTGPPVLFGDLLGSFFNAMIKFSLSTYYSALDFYYYE
jgi:hypothetical protein